MFGFHESLQCQVRKVVRVGNSWGRGLGKYQQREVLWAAVAGKSKKKVLAFFCSREDWIRSAKEYMARKRQLCSVGHTQVLLVIWQRHGYRQEPRL